MACGWQHTNCGASLFSYIRSIDNTRDGGSNIRKGNRILREKEEHVFSLKLMDPAGTQPRVCYLQKKTEDR